MNPNPLLKKQASLLELDKETKRSLENKTKLLVSLIKEEIERQNIQAATFLGGSFAKGTLIKKDVYDVDLFIRFDWRYEDLSGLLAKIVEKISKKAHMPFKLLHGSRDYFQLIADKSLVFEIIPVYQIKKPKEARNVTDLSYFHVSYVKKKLHNDQLRAQVMLAKRFCQAQRVYGAESYVRGFSGYGLECLIIHYKSFLNMLKKLVKVKERVIIDLDKHYKNESDVLLSVNESRLKSPIILVDPTWKERNVLAALSKERFNRFQEVARSFLASPSSSFFEVKEFNPEAKGKSSKNAESLHLKIKTDKQAGDIAGTKMKKFSEFLSHELGHYFEISKKDYVYSGEQESDFYIILKRKDKIILFGPPKGMEAHAQAFKKAHKNVFEKSGRLYSELKIDFSAKQFVQKFIKEEKDKIKEMGITSLTVL